MPPPDGSTGGEPRFLRLSKAHTSCRIFLQCIHRPSYRNLSPGIAGNEFDRAFEDLDTKVSWSGGSPEETRLHAPPAATPNLTTSTESSLGAPANVVEPMGGKCSVTDRDLARQLRSDTVETDNPPNSDTTFSYPEDIADPGVCPETIVADPEKRRAPPEGAATIGDEAPVLSPDGTSSPDNTAGVGQATGVREVSPNRLSPLDRARIVDSSTHDHRHYPHTASSLSSHCISGRDSSHA
ncbi:hypothetical protein D8B26_005405 [Coccidioides posadasii str. Silveira]|uniref:uncharacterized protein n=1 Tax=Coccidioides posadasii (strain RMSCC 757 / Silveira) TaxID=443226 RepID=UPI001BED8F6B|nr:hypothetical protein D8B26_005405 [Coccidioides posadasii str. Silveira]